MENKFNKLEESLYILYKCVSNMELSKSLYKSIEESSIMKKELKKQYAFISINNLYLYTYHFITEEKIFIGLMSDYAKVSKYIEFKKEQKEILSKFNRAKDGIVEYRNSMVGHYFRNKKNEFIDLSKLTEVTPSTATEIFYYSDICNSLFFLISKLFEEEFEISKKKGEIYQQNVKDKFVQIRELEDELNKLKQVINDYKLEN